MQKVSALIARAASTRFAIAVSEVIETMRPLPIRPIAGAPDFVSGVAIIRGAPVPVVELARLLEPNTKTHAKRFITVRAGARTAALAVDSVLDVREVDRAELSALPPLLQGADRVRVEALGALDRELLVVLGTATLIPESVFVALEKVS